MPRYQSMYNVPLTPLTASQSGGEAGGGGGGGTSSKHSTTRRAVSKVVLSQTKKGKGKKRTVNTYDGDYDYEVDDDDDNSDESTYSDETDADYDDDDDDDDYTDTECDCDSDVDEDDIKTVKNKSSTVDASKSRKSKKVVKTANTSKQASKSFGLQQHNVAHVLTKYMQLNKSERTEAMIAPFATADIQVLSFMAKQILSKNIKLHGGVKLQDALRILVEGSLEQKRSILITQPSLLTTMIKKSKGKLTNMTKQKSPKPTAAHGLGLV